MKVQSTTITELITQIEENLSDLEKKQPIKRCAHRKTYELLCTLLPEQEEQIPWPIEDYRQAPRAIERLISLMVSAEMDCQTLEELSELSNSIKNTNCYLRAKPQLGWDDEWFGRIEEKLNNFFNEKSYNQRIVDLLTQGSEEQFASICIYPVKVDIWEHVYRRLPELKSEYPRQQAW